MRRHLLAACLAAVLAGLAPAAGQAQSGESITLATAGLSLFNYLPISLARNIGAFKEQGLDVQISDFQGGQKSIESLVGGSIELAVASFDNAIFLQTKGIRIVNIALVNHSIGGVIAIDAKNAAKVASPKDVKGFLFGVSSPGSATHRMLNLYLGKGGLKPTDVSVQGLGGGASAVAAIQSGRLDGFVHAEPVVSHVLKDGKFKILADGRTEEGMKFLYGGYIAATTILSTPEVIAKRPQAVQKFISAIVRTLKWMKSAPLDEVMSKVPPEFYGPDRDAYRAILAAQLPIFNPNGILDRGAVDRTLESMIGEGSISRDTPIKLEDTYDNRFADAANK